VVGTPGKVQDLIKKRLIPLAEIKVRGKRAASDEARGLCNVAEAFMAYGVGARASCVQVFVLDEADQMVEGAGGGDTHSMGQNVTEIFRCAHLRPRFSGCGVQAALQAAF
jgi:hypothetical protein